ncbi:MAG: hypothetical protein ACE5ID_11550 [Acidobacteriota bacterium]
MSPRKKPQQDPLRERILRVIQMVEALRRENSELQAQLEETKKRIHKMEAEKGTVRRRVSRMLEIIRA